MVVDKLGNIRRAFVARVDLNERLRPVSILRVNRFDLLTDVICVDRRDRRCEVLVLVDDAFAQGKNIESGSAHFSPFRARLSERSLGKSPSDETPRKTPLGSAFSSIVTVRNTPLRDKNHRIIRCEAWPASSCAGQLVPSLLNGHPLCRMVPSD